jgi:hypothetical protein
MPLVEFAGVSGVGKTTLLATLLQQEKLRNWHNTTGTLPLSPLVFADTSEVLTGTLLKLWEQRKQHVKELSESEALKNFYLSLASWHLRWDGAFEHHFSGSYETIDEHFLQILSPEISWLVHAHPKEAEMLLGHRNFILLTDAAENILHRVRRRQATGLLRPHLEGKSDTKIIADSKGFQAGMLSFLQDHQHFGYNWFVVDMSKGFEAAVIQTKAFLLGLENISKAAQQ